jgi:hypothetical protein
VVDCQRLVRAYDAGCPHAEVFLRGLGSARPQCLLCLDPLLFLVDEVGLPLEKLPDGFNILLFLLDDV